MVVQAGLSPAPTSAAPAGRDDCAGVLCGGGGARTALGRYVVWWGGDEGMGSWRLSLVELLDFAVATKRKLVLPHVAHGRVVQHCGPNSHTMSHHLSTTWTSWARAWCR